MNKRDKQALADYIRATADALWLKDWDFDLFYGEPSMPEDKGDGDQDWGLSIEQTRHRQHATITIPEDFKERYTKTMQKEGIAHELIHCHFMRCWDQVRVDLMRQLGQGAYDIFVDSFERNLEYGVDGLAYAFACSMPDIRWPKKK